MINDKGILIKNIYYMLTYAYQTLKQSTYEEIETEDFDNIHDLFAAILSKGLAAQIKQGLYREYIVLEEDLSTLRGKLNMPGTIRNRINQTDKLSCEFDELSENNIFNQILKTAMYILIRQDTIKSEHKAILKKNLLFFSGVEAIDPQGVDWSRLRFQRNNQNYRMLINICNMLMDGLLMSTEKGRHKLATFLDEQRMCRLYEKFILEYYRYHHPEYRANPDQIAWDVDDGVIDFLPAMQTDITLRYGGKILIIDAKYYSHTMQSQFDTYSIHSGNLYQIFTYVKNLDKDNTGNVAGALLYAKTEETIQPDNRYSVGGNQIIVRTLDLGLPFQYIEEQLEKLAIEYFKK